MKKLSTNIITENGETKKITVFVEEETAAALAHCDEEIRHLYILEEHEAQNLTRKETRRHISYESITEKGLDFVSPEESPSDRLIRSEEEKRLHNAMVSLTDKQYKILWLVAVDGLSFHEVGRLLGLNWDTVREHYRAAVKKVQKNF